MKGDGKMETIVATIDLVKKYDPEYLDACATAFKLYRQTQGVELKSFPETFVSILNENGMPVGGCTVKIKSDGPLMVEKYIDNPGQHFPGGKMPPPSQLAEIGYFHIERPYRFLCFALGAMALEYAYSQGIKYLYATCSEVTAHIVDDMGVGYKRLAKANINRAGYSPEEYEMWSKRYFTLNPEVRLSDIYNDAMPTYRKRLATEKNWLPEFTLGQRFSEAIGPETANWVSRQVQNFRTDYPIDILPAFVIPKAPATANMPAAA